MGQLSFFTTGPKLTQTVRDLWTEAKPYNALEILEGMNDLDKIDFVTGKYKFEGDTRIDGTLDVVQETDPVQQPDIWTILAILSRKYVLSFLDKNPIDKLKLFIK